MGIDCSGLVQVVFSICGMQLQRDASEQAEEGEDIYDLSESKAGDLVFFENSEGKIIHVGILLNPHQLIHASGRVKIETLDSKGIISGQTKEYTHKLKVIKRLI
jgi:cell wall-associated NlpC family hydrolase